MSFSATDIVATIAALTAVLMAGSTLLTVNTRLYALQTILIAVLTAMLAYQRSEPPLYAIALVIGLVKGYGVAVFVERIMKKVGVNNDPGTIMAAPLAMHLCVLLMGLSFFLSRGLPSSLIPGQTWITATASISLLFSGLIFMLTRRIALSQIVGFLVIENGIYLFAQALTSGMPLVVEMGVLLDVLVGVMIAGLIIFGIQKSFEHVDVTQLTELKE